MRFAMLAISAIADPAAMPLHQSRVQAARSDAARKFKLFVHVLASNAKNSSGVPYSVERRLSFIAAGDMSILHNYK